MILLHINMLLLFNTFVRTFEGIRYHNIILLLFSSYYIFHSFVHILHMCLSIIIYYAKSSSSSSTTIIDHSNMYYVLLFIYLAHHLSSSSVARYCIILYLFISFPFVVIIFAYSMQGTFIRTLEGTYERMN